MGYLHNKIKSKGRCYISRLKTMHGDIIQTVVFVLTRINGRQRDTAALVYQTSPHNRTTPPFFDLCRSERVVSGD